MILKYFFVIGIDTVLSEPCFYHNTSRIVQTVDFDNKFQSWHFQTLSKKNKYIIQLQICNQIRTSKKTTKQSNKLLFHITTHTKKKENLANFSLIKKAMAYVARVSFEAQNTSWSCLIFQHHQKCKKDLYPRLSNRKPKITGPGSNAR